MVSKGTQESPPARQVEFLEMDERNFSQQRYYIIMTKKYTDWRSWWDGLRTNIFKCIGTTGIAYLGTNAVQGMGATGMGISLKQAGCFFGVHIALEVFGYMQANQPAVIIETVEEKHVVKDGSVTETGSSTTTTTTPVDPAIKTP
jgi:hypothetical protein